jgi:hypothetical protein
MSHTEPTTETWFCWKEFVPVEGDDGRPRLLTPWSDPMEHEFPFDFLAYTEAEAEELLDNFDARDEADETGWVLVKMTLEPIRRVTRPSN